MNDAINHTACETLFTQARTHNGWLDKPVSDAQLQAWHEEFMREHIEPIVLSKGEALLRQQGRYQSHQCGFHLACRECWPESRDSLPLRHPSLPARPFHKTSDTCQQFSAVLDRLYG